MIVEQLGLMPYRQAWARQEAAHDAVVAGGEERLLIVEHPPVITFGRRPGMEGNIVASPAELERRGVEVVPSDRGGDVTFHGPGQLVAYPIVRLIDHHLSVGGYVRRLEETMIAALADIGIAARKDDSGIGVWTDDHGELAKICALGVRIRKGVSMHGIALNITTDLSYFDLIIPCGLVGKRVTSVSKVMGANAPSPSEVRRVVIDKFFKAFA